MKIQFRMGKSSLDKNPIQIEEPILNWIEPNYKYGPVWFGL